MILNGIILIAIICALIAAETTDLRRSTIALAGIGICLVSVFLLFSLYLFALFHLAVIGGIIWLIKNNLEINRIFREKEPPGSLFGYLGLAGFVLAAFYLFWPVFCAFPSPLRLSTEYLKTVRLYDVLGMLVIIAVAMIAAMSILRSNKTKEPE
ncbi:MAG: hypothetical protein KKC80_07140 [Candidatus Margulisbacteria bacterium]|nr:hypothetical protein [Candidatus Margulisiibacteriota bacterium]MBU1617712.1 hypothetical protein [Candidatus Margulisiibacteriota bacterium]